jgi:hypothetical protein
MMTYAVTNPHLSLMISLAERPEVGLRRDSYQRDSKFRFDFMDQASEVRREPADRDGTI